MVQNVGEEIIQSGIVLVKFNVVPQMEVREQIKYILLNKFTYFL